MKTIEKSKIFALLISSILIMGCNSSVVQYDYVAKGDLIYVDSQDDPAFGRIGVIVSDTFLKDRYGNNCHALVTFDPKTAPFGYRSIRLDDICKIHYDDEFYKYLEMQIKGGFNREIINSLKALWDKYKKRLTREGE